MIAVMMYLLCVFRTSIIKNATTKLFENNVVERYFTQEIDCASGEDRVIVAQRPGLCTTLTSKSTLTTTP